MTLYYYDRNLKNIHNLADHTKIAALKWHDYLVKNNINILIYETIRTKEQQQANVKKGASQTMTSYHLVGQALDFVPVAEGGRTDWNGYMVADIQKAVQYAKSLGFEWGGDWKSFIDRPHLQYNHKGYGTDTWGKVKIASEPKKGPEKNIYFETGGYSGESLSNIHTFLVENDFWFSVSRKNEGGSLMFTVGGFTQGKDNTLDMESFLVKNEYWFKKYQK